MNNDYNKGLSFFVILFMCACVAYMRHIKQSFIMEGHGYEQVGLMQMTDANKGEIYIPIFRKTK